MLLCFLFIVSYYFILQPSYDTPENELWEKNVDAVFNSTNSYLVPDGENSYYLYYNGELVGDIPAEDVISGLCDIPIKKGDTD